MQMQETYTKIEQEAIRAIRNNIQANGAIPSVRELMAVLGYKSPRSAALIIERLQDKGVLKRKTSGGLQFIDPSIGKEQDQVAQTVNVPLLGAIACGLPIYAEENIEAFIPVSLKIASPPHGYFFLKAQGDSMDEKGIADGSLVLVRQQPNAVNGDVVVALIDDHATLKEFHQQEDVIILKPKSTNKRHKPILLTADFKIQGIVVKTFGDFIEL